jgi:hypothetical protein
MDVFFRLKEWWNNIKNIYHTPSMEEKRKAKFWGWVIAVVIAPVVIALLAVVF